MAENYINSEKNSNGRKVQTAKNAEQCAAFNAVGDVNTLIHSQAVTSADDLHYIPTAAECQALDNCYKAYEVILSEEYAPGRKDSEILARFYNRLGDVLKAERAGDCGTSLGFAQGVKCDKKLSAAEYERLRVIDEKKRLAAANFCKIRGCQQCEKRRAIKQAIKNAACLDWIQKHYPGTQNLLLTLTEKNVSLEDLYCDFQQFMLALKRFKDRYFYFSHGKNKRFPSIIGYISRIELTRNPEDGTFHLHCHFLLAVTKEYFSRFNSDYTTTEEFAQAWRECLGVDYTPVCDVRAVSGSSWEQVHEVSKYIVKPLGLYTEDEDINFRIWSTVFNRVLVGRRLVSCGGVFREAVRALGLEDVEKDLNDFLQSDEFRFWLLRWWRWSADDKKHLLEDEFIYSAEEFAELRARHFRGVKKGGENGAR